MIARLLRHNDPSTSLQIVCLGLLTKQVFGRLVLTTIAEPRWVCALSVLNGTTEFVLRATSTCRDKLLYRCLFGRCLGLRQDVHANMNAHRNRRLRSQISMLETLGDLIAIWNGV